MKEIDIDDHGMTPEDVRPPEHEVLCPDCGGSGVAEGGEGCPTCGGTGRLPGSVSDS